MSEFVDDCRREWRRLGVPEVIANEMAADLEADLREAEAEGGSAEDVLGNAAFDPRSFARAWAYERDVVPADAEPVEPPAAARGTTGRHRLLLIAAIAAVLLGAALLVVSSTGLPVRSASAAIQVPFRLRVGPLVPPPRVRFIVPGAFAAPAQGTVIVHPFVRTLGGLLLLAGLAGLGLVAVLRALSTRSGQRASG